LFTRRFGKFTSRLPHRYTYSIHRLTPNSTKSTFYPLIFITPEEFTNFKGFNSITIPPNRIQNIRNIAGFTELKRIL
jgi:hypothetical protein